MYRSEYESRGGATILRVGVQISLRAKRAENFWGLYPTYAILGGTAATKRGISDRVAAISYWSCSRIYRPI